MTGAATASFDYDADGKQVTATVNGVTAVYVGQHYEVKNSVVTKYYFAGATRIAVRTDGTLSYLLGDHLGSSSVTTNANGVKTASALYKAFGETRYTDGNLGTDYKFTGQREEASLGIYFFNARWFDPSIGRFAQADTMIPQSQGTQAYDRYAYTSNNPLRYTDPTGHRNCEEDGYDCENEKEEEIVYPEIVGTDWTTEEITAIYVAWLLLVREFGSQAALLEALGGPISFVHIPTGLLDAVAVANEPLNMVFVDSEVFAAQGDYMTWYALHEVGHIFDANNSGGNPALYKSNSFVQAYIPGGCNLNWHGCTGSQWNPTDLGTTKYGLSDGSQEDFADSFASTILYNAYMPKNTTFMNVSPDRMTIINTWISVFAQ